MKPTRNQIEMPDSWQPEEAPEKPRFPRKDALAVARQCVELLAPVCEQLKVCGSLRRRRETVGDVEIVFVPRTRIVSPERRDLLGAVLEAEARLSQAGEMLDAAVASGGLAKRPKRDGTFTWGKHIRLAVHAASGIPVDFFATDAASWWNTVACRTGGAKTNVEVCARAIAKGWKWSPSPEEGGFTRRIGLSEKVELYQPESEEAVFAFVGMKYLEPERRL